MKKIEVDNVVLGAGISGLSAGYHLKLKNKNFLVLEKTLEYGGLCGNFEIEGFLFDKFIHLSFSKDKYVRDLFEKNSEEIAHIPNAYNYYNGLFLKHPAQNNLYPLDLKEKNKILKDFKRKKDLLEKDIKDYEKWLRVQYGDYFAEKFPMKYTKKYWCKDAKDMSTNWIGNRMYKPSYEEIVKGMHSEDTPITYYASKMYYPKVGGYKTYLTEIVKSIKNNIEYNFEVIELDLEKKELKSKNGKIYKYHKIFSSLPLTELVKITKNIPNNYKKEARNLEYTSGYMVSLGLKTKNIPPYLWIYVYDEEFLSTRIYSPSLKSKANCPLGCSSLQVEIYFTKEKKILLKKNDILNNVILELEKMNIIKKEDITVKDIRKEKYANIIFTNKTYRSRESLKNYYKKNNIISIGRFGEWDYFWSDQSLMSGKKGVDRTYD